MTTQNNSFSDFEPNGASPFAPDDDRDSSGVSSELANMDDVYAQTEAYDGDSVPDGKYQARIDTVRLDKSRSGQPLLKYDLIILSGPQAGRHLFKNSVITPKSLPFFKADLSVAGLELVKLSDLPSNLESLLDVALEVTKRTKDEFTNIYFNKKLSIPATGETPEKGRVPF